MRLTVFILAVGLVAAWQAAARIGDAGGEAAARGQFGAALVQLLPLAEAGDVQAQKSVAAMYRYGRRGAPLDPAASVRWSQHAAEQGDVESMRLVAGAYQTGRGVVGNAEKAEDWYRRAAQAGDVIARLALGEIFLDRANGQRDPRAAFEWLSRAAEQGNGPARYRLGDLYVAEDSVPHDLIRARMWYILAAGTGKAVAGDEHNDDLLRHALSDAEHYSARRLANALARSLSD